MIDVSSRVPNRIRKFKAKWGVDVEVKRASTYGMAYIYLDGLQIGYGDTMTNAFSAAEKYMKKSFDDRNKDGDALQRLISK